jgi:signal transduction histidine kinase
MTLPPLVVIYFFYGLAFFSMGLLVAIEGGHSTDARLRMALRPLAVFGLVHALHEWLEMFMLMGHFDGNTLSLISLVTFILLAFSFLSLAAFGSYLLSGIESTGRISLMIPLALEAVWILGLILLRNQYVQADLADIAVAWTRYSIAIPASLLAAAGLVVQQRTFRHAGLIRFGRDSLWAAVAFGWYGLVGQIFTAPTLLPPSTFLNTELFIDLFGFPIQLLRAITATFASIFIIRFLRAFQVESERKIAELQVARLYESQQREQLRTEFFRNVVSAQESERQRIARDLHDETGQALTAIGMGLRGLADETDESRRHTTLSQLQSLTSDSLVELQRIIADLRPAHLDDLGLSATLRWYASRVQELTSINIHMDIKGAEPVLDDAVKVTIFRIVQESLNNVTKHAKASHVNVHLDYQRNKTRISIRDNGKGFDMNNVHNDVERVSLGLAGMQERAMLLGGSVKVHSLSGYGTQMDAEIPYQVEKLEGIRNDTSIAG